ncbi:S41 family peptidase [Allokutzneria albata]|uniref:Carboxyl-terminal processing protease n=1 Tax=Allokutzneria albata TaxID=211114 RepID=A0A1G9W6Y6_ALLAB|nr:S41 family peptidase [Allokutzneria albata]SDM79775.1 carboxyl-terminal processing protease [Allokutzneria albata]
MDLVWPAGAEFDDRALLLSDALPVMEFELGVPVRLVREDPGTGPRWLCRVDPDHDGPAVLRRNGDLIESVGRTLDEMWETFSLRHTWLRTGQDTYAVDAADLTEAVDRIINEVRFSYPAFALRGLDWDQLCEHYAPKVLTADDPFAVCQEWVAQLGDAHTAVHAAPRPLPLPYKAFRSTFTDVPEGSAAWEAGVRPGWRLHAPHHDDIARRTGASPHMLPYLIGRRLLSSTGSQQWRAFGPGGEDVTWTEKPTGLPFGDLVTWQEDGRIRIKQWVANSGIAEALDTALTELGDCAELTLDLRGNAGGNVVLAWATRDRFLREETVLGSVRYCIDGKLSDPVPMIGTPSNGVRWGGRLTVLTDPMTYSASEDFLLGLQGLDHVRVVGEPSGGGSGRPRTVRLLPGWTLNISTVLTYDRNGHCVEGSGIPVNVSKQWR